MIQKTQQGSHSPTIPQFFQKMLGARDDLGIPEAMGTGTEQWCHISQAAAFRSQIRVVVRGRPGNAAFSTQGQAACEVYHHPYPRIISHGVSFHISAPLTDTRLGLDEDAGNVHTHLPRGGNKAIPVFPVNIPDGITHCPHTAERHQHQQDRRHPCSGHLITSSIQPQIQLPLLLIH